MDCNLFLLSRRSQVFPDIFGCYEYIGTIGTRKLSTLGTAAGSSVQMLHWTMLNDPGHSNFLCDKAK